MEERATAEASSVAMRNWKVDVWRGDNSATRTGWRGRFNLSQQRERASRAECSDIIGEFSGIKWREVEQGKEYSVKDGGII